jgi:hypothetical protein
MKFLSNAIFSAFCYFPLFTPIYPPEHPVITHLQPISFPNIGDRMSRQCIMKTRIFLFVTSYVADGRKGL